MALPASWGKVRVYGTYTARDGSPAVGSVAFVSPQIVVVGGVTIVPRNIVCELDADGSFEYDLPATNDADIAPDGWAYTIRERFDGGGGRAAYAISVPLGGGDINLATVAPAVPADEMSTLELWQLADVDDTAEDTTDGYALCWNSTTNKWEPRAVSGGGGSGDVVGPASATDDRIAAFDSTTGKLIKQGSVTATAVASHLGSTSNPHSVTAAQAGADPTGTAAAAVSAHSGAVDPHGDRAYADGLAGNYATAGHNHSGVYQPLATVLTNTTAAFTTAQETKLAGIEAAADVTDAGNVGTAIDGATAKTTPVDADTVPLIDSAASNVLKKLSWANIKATAKAYFDTLYQVILVSGTNIKTVNSTSLLGSGDIAISASPAGSGTELQYRNGSSFGAMTGTAWDDTNRAETRTGATVTTSNPVQSFTQTWNAGAVTFSGWKINITNTASAAASLVSDWQVNGTSLLNLRSDGQLYVKSILIDGGGAGTATLDVGGLGNALRTAQLNITNSINFGNGFATLSSGYNAGISITHWAASTGGIVLNPGGSDYVEQRRGTNAQTFRAYGTYTDASNYVRASLAATSTAVTLAAETAGTGANDVPVVLAPAGTSQVEVGNGVQFTEMTAPSAPAANKVILFAQDNGAGKTQLMALFPSGASQQVAIEP